MYDVVIIGGGPGGYVAAIKAAQLGAKVALIEKESLGGICLNHGCIPTKALIKSSKVYQTIKDSESFGIIGAQEADFDWQKIIKRKDKIVKQLTNGVAFLLRKNKVDVYNGYGEIVDNKNVKVGDDILVTKNIIIATGAHAIIPPIEGAKEAYQNKYLLTSKELLNIEKFPDSLTIIGGGVIGIEFATIFNLLGAKVTIIEMLPSILNNIDEEIKTAYTRKLKKDGIEILTNATVTKIDNNKVTYQKDEIEKEVKSELVLMAVGTQANSKAFEHLNLKMERANIVTDQYLRTSIEGIYAIGDVNGKEMLAHVASHEGIIAVHHLLNKETRPMDYGKIPACVYGSPEIAMIGLTEEEAKAQNLNYKVSKVPLAAIGKALADGEKEGFIKLIVEEQYKEIIGVHIYAYGATELISEYSLAMIAEASAYEISAAIHPHPTLSELTLEAALGAIDKPIHL